MGCRYFVTDITPLNRVGAHALRSKGRRNCRRDEQGNEGRNEHSYESSGVKNVDRVKRVCEQMNESARLRCARGSKVTMTRGAS